MKGAIILAIYLIFSVVLRPVFEQQLTKRNVSKIASREEARCVGKVFDKYFKFEDETHPRVMRKEEKAMKVKAIVMMAAVTMVLGACTTTQKKTETCACGAHSAEMAKKDCSSGECPTKKSAGCADCQDMEAKSGK